VISSGFAVSHAIWPQSGAFLAVNPLRRAESDLLSVLGHSSLLHLLPSPVFVRIGDRSMGMLKEFKEFAMRGNVVDMAVGIIIGAAFGKIVSSFVNDVLMPPLGMLIGKVDFSDLAVTLKAASSAAEKPVLMRYGVFLNAIIDFTILAFAIFLMIKAMNTLSRKRADAPPPKPSGEEVLLTEIRDLLKVRN